MIECLVVIGLVVAAWYVFRSCMQDYLIDKEITEYANRQYAGSAKFWREYRRKLIANGAPQNEIDEAEQFYNEAMGNIRK